MNTKIEIQSALAIYFHVLDTEYIQKDIERGDIYGVNQVNYRGFTF